jgi:hypothetical protein
MNEYLWDELINHRHDIMIPITIIYITILYYLNKRARQIDLGVYRPSWLIKKITEVFYGTSK